MPLQDDVFFPVAEEKIFNPRTGEFTGQKMILNGNNNKFISVVSEEYSPISNIEILEAIQGSIDKFGGRLADSRMYSNSHSFLSFDMPVNHQVEKGDVVKMRVKFQNSFNGSLKFGMSVEAVRLICSNGMVLGKNFFDIQKTHKKISVDWVAEETSTVLENGVKLFSEKSLIYNKMNETSFSQVEVPKILEAMSVFPERIADKVRLNMTKQKPSTVWDFYNNGTYVLTHQVDKNNYSALKTSEQFFERVVSLMN